MTYRDHIASYIPKNEQEQVDQATILRFIADHPDVLERTNTVAHLTSSAIVVNSSLTKVLFAHHNLYQSWGWVGGHNDGDPDLLRVALTEAEEETGLSGLKALQDSIFMLDVIHVTHHQKHGHYVGDHLHLNVTYLVVADETHPLRHKPDENSAVRWFTFEEALKHVSEPRMLPIYQKAFTAIDAIKNRP
jgi:8-oxo-dGTP pyrophosphatase MutT (NUDIX family)